MQLAGILVWWLFISAIGLAALPIAFSLFKFLPDRGYAFSKPLGLLLIGLLAWLIGYLHFSAFTIIACFIMMAGISYWLWSQNREAIVEFLRKKSGYVMAVELFFFAVFLLFLLFRMYNPDILGTEKFMDLAFMNAISRASSLPPYDPWLSGSSFTISYYYFGYLLMAMFVKVSGVAPAVGFNLALGLLFALSGIALVGLLYNLTRSLTAAVAGWGGIFLLGNLDGFRQVLTTHSINNFNWWTPSRVIPDTINEFPFFSFLLGDMHPHMLAIPFVLLALAFGLNHIKSDEPSLNLKDPERLTRTLVWGVVIGSLGFLNSWDLPTTYFVAMLAVFFQQYRLQGSLRQMPWKEMLATLGLMLAAAAVPFLPFYMNFHNQAKGIGVTTQNTQLGDYLLIFGLFTFMVLTFLACRYHAWFVALLAQPGEKKSGSKKTMSCPECGAGIREGKRICGQCGYQLKSADFPDQAPDSGSPLALPASEAPAGVRKFFLFLLQPVAFAKQQDIRVMASVGLAVLALVAAAAFAKSMFLALVILAGLSVALLLLTRVDRPETVFALGLLFTAWLLVFGCEVLHINDTFNPPLDRMNTVFKFYYQAWFLMGVAAVYGVIWAFRYSMRNLNLRLAWMVGLAILIAASLVYPYAAILVKTNHFNNYPTLDGSYYLNVSYAGDREAIEWLRQNVSGNPVVLEATGSEYTDFARVSTFSGLPTVLGWGGHELQWRGNWDEPGKRIPDIDALYGSMDLDQTRSLLDKYNIEYVFVGTLERQKYSALALTKFSMLMNLAHENPNGVLVYKRK